MSFPLFALIASHITPSPLISLQLASGNGSVAPWFCPCSLSFRLPPHAIVLLLLIRQTVPVVHHLDARCLVSGSPNIRSGPTDHFISFAFTYARRIPRRSLPEPRKFSVYHVQRIFYSGICSLSSWYIQYMSPKRFTNLPIRSYPNYIYISQLSICPSQTPFFSAVNGRVGSC